ncbi:MAG TPA: hypothetical protein O0Y06_06490 [Methanocorpusculum sp.]|nr:hypothetical protein [Methanocorpusculum sp.]HJK80533.1 hypothetical protein [Methanocorpusculum sp.]
MNPKKIRVQVTLTETLSRKLEAMRARGLSDGSIVELALSAYFEKEGVTV